MNAVTNFFHKSLSILFLLMFLFIFAVAVISISVVSPESIGSAAPPIVGIIFLTFELTMLILIRGGTLKEP